MSALLALLAFQAGHAHHGATPAAAPPGHDTAGHQGHAAPAGASPHAGHMPPAMPAHDMSGHAGHAMPPAGHAAPPPPSDHAADAVYDPARMAAARARLKHESGGMAQSMLLVDRLEWRAGKGRDGYGWEGEWWFGGDLDRLVVKSEGEGERGRRLEQAEVQALWSRAADPWWNLQAGVRQDLQRGARRTHAVLGIEGLAPYWLQADAALFLSHKGELTARAEASHDMRLTQRLILQPAAEANLSAQRVRALGLGRGLTSFELGARLRYEIDRPFAPYVGVHWERAVGRTARFARARGDDVGGVRAVAGLRFWF